MSELWCGLHYRVLARGREARPAPSRLWALAAGANLARANRSDLDVLHCGHTRDCMRRGLREWWGIEGPEGVAPVLAVLRDSPDRAAFRELHRYLSSVGDAGYERWIRDQPMAERGRLAFVRRFAAWFKNGDLLAWDRVRAINLCRFAYTAGWLGAESAWLEMLVAARELQSVHAGWDELGENYLLAWRHWQRGGEPTLELSQAMAWLRASPASPWQRLDWQLPLLG